ncbi:MAG: TIGR02646 family protein [Spirochaetes bacterium GWD1_27_9]|nr:MAG: TIGR02646 family protein [Spirochaetes bacterium GWB1_27_13]OHD20438.1 MAG: TIGR02646 family protein [Spirochaetes bacterium GWC1_27_15]OHD32022.1 MAG: TIGR02646 family protein [Spirochaetes bacterium GWD1_27_9]
MIKVNKDLTKIPASLSEDKTNNARNKIIDSQKYLDKYDNYYKNDDVKELLKTIYNKKCAYCEKSVLDNTPPIEHYRPKSIYWWLSFSWDNLLLCCEECNRNKRKKFEINGYKVEFKDTDLQNIHTLGKDYNKTEKPKMINPEEEDVESKLIFSEDGKIDSNDERVKYTITTCEIDRFEANEKRKSKWDEFKNGLNNIITSFNPPENQIREYISKKFIEFSKPTTEYSAFLKFAIRNFLKSKKNNG